MIVYFNGKYEDEKDVKISPFDRGFQYADGVYEVLRTYNKKYFMMEEHLERLKYSLREVRIEGFENFGKPAVIFDELKKKNAYEDTEVVVYIQITRGKAFPRKHNFPGMQTEPTVIITMTPAGIRKEFLENGVKIISEEDIRWERCDIKSISLLPSVLMNQKAFENGAYETVWIKNGYLSEGTHTNFFGVKAGKVYSYPLSNHILAGITREVIWELCGKLGIEFINAGIKESEIKDFEEFFLSGTTTEVMPVTYVNDVEIGGGIPGAVTKKIQNAFQELISSY